MHPYRVTMPVVVLEATGHYHRNLVGYLKRSGWIHYIVNPLQAKRSKGTQLRKVKTDAADAWHLAEMNYRGDVKAHRSHRSSRLEMSRVTGSCGYHNWAKEHFKMEISFVFRLCSR
ncbi:UNVERIFIED_CONTAM: transposase [Paenibacillus sp. PvR008]